MTRPAEIRLREGDTPGTSAAAYEPGAELPELRFTLEPDVIREYILTVEADPALYVHEDRPVAPPHVLCPYLMPVLYLRYPPAQGIIQAEVGWDWHHPIYADEATEVTVTGRVTDRYERSGNWFVRWEAAFRRSDGTLLAKASNRICVPE